MMSFDLLTEDGEQTIPIMDGLVINQENSHQSWVLELFIQSEYRPIFEQLQTAGDVFEARAVISFPDNEPAPFSLVVCAIENIGDHISVLLKGTIKARRKRYAELLLQQLLAEGLSNEELLDRFKQGMLQRPKISSHHQQGNV